jgi:N-formylglutamate amidohydrolase
MRCRSCVYLFYGGQNENCKANGLANRSPRIWEASAPKLIGIFEGQGFSVAVNSPFAGTLAPMTHYRKNLNVHSLMIEVNRALYCDEKTGLKCDNFEEISQLIREALVHSCARVTLPLS